MSRRQDCVAPAVGAEKKGGTLDGRDIVSLRVAPPLPIRWRAPVFHEPRYLISIEVGYLTDEW